MAIEWRNIDELRLDLSTKSASRGLLQMMLNTLRIYGFGPPLVIDYRGTVLQGRVRLQLAKQLGWEALPVQVAETGPQQPAPFASTFANLFPEGYGDAS